MIPVLAPTPPQNTSCTVGVRFIPQAAGTRTGTVQFVTNALSNPSVRLTGTATAPSSVVTVLSPNGGERLFTLNNAALQWSYSGVAPASFRVLFSSNGGIDFAPVCTGLAPSARGCTWASPSPITSTGRMKVEALCRPALRSPPTHRTRTSVLWRGQESLP